MSREKSTGVDIFKKVLFTLDISTEEFAEYAGVSRATAYKWKRQGTPLPSEVVIKLAQDHGFTCQWLLFGTGEMLQSEGGQSDSIRKSDSDTPNILETVPFQEFQNLQNRYIDLADEFRKVVSEAMKDRELADKYNEEMNDLLIFCNMLIDELVRVDTTQKVWQAALEKAIKNTKKETGRDLPGELDKVAS